MAQTNYLSLVPDPPPTLPNLQPGVPALTDFQFIIQSLLAVAARLLGIAAFVMLIVGGFQMLTSGGDPKKTEQGHKTITAAIVGIAIVVGGWFALTILEQLTGAKITILNLCFTPNCQ